MAHSRTARKAVRQNVARNALNKWRLKAMRDTIKDFNKLVAEHSTPEKLQEQFLKCQKVIDRTAQKGVIHKNQAARRKSRLSAKVKLMKTAKPVAKATKSSAKKA
jgi:small subunit ribosomal protein S20